MSNSRASTKLEPPAQGSKRDLVAPLDFAGVPRQNRPMPSEGLVVVTGASGFIAAHLVRELLERGYRVRGTLRRIDKQRELDRLSEAAPDGRLSFVEADLLREGSFDAAVDGAAAVMHAASPYVLNASDPRRDLVDPAVRGTLNVLRSCAGAASVRRVVVTSSMAAITDEPESGHILTENDWNDKSSLGRNPYYYAKTLAEWAAWQFVRDTPSGFDLVAINPFMVIGPSLTPAINTSNRLFVDLLKGTYPGVINLSWGFVDVRDVALAHIRAMETAAAHGRYICAADVVSMREIVELLGRSAHADDRLPRLGLDCAVGDVAVMLGSYFQGGGVGSYLRTHVGRVPRYDNGKIRRELGLTFRDVRRTIVETVEDLRAWGHLPAGPAHADPSASFLPHR